MLRSCHSLIHSTLGWAGGCAATLQSLHRSITATQHNTAVMLRCNGCRAVLIAHQSRTVAAKLAGSQQALRQCCETAGSSQADHGCYVTPENLCAAVITCRTYARTVAALLIKENKVPRTSAHQNPTCAAKLPSSQQALRQCCDSAGSRQAGRPSQQHAAGHQAVPCYLVNDRCCQQHTCQLCCCSQAERDVPAAAAEKAKQGVLIVSAASLKPPGNALLPCQ